MKHIIKIYNTLTRKKETFNPIVENHVGMYVCGPTVYGEPHLGHARPGITFDIIFRYFKHLGYKTRYVRNITDAGHLENDADSGEDKITRKAKLEKLEPMEVVQVYTLAYHKAMQILNCLPPSIEPRATGHIIEQIEMIKKIINTGFAYETNGSVYFDVKKYSEKHKYGILSGRNLDETLEGTRSLEGQEEKKNPFDFALWKNAEKNHIMKWDSPWGKGFPGWHMECSAMSEKYLGPVFDIHGGGMDLIFPHHEAEIAQSNACNKSNPAKYWLHNNMVTIDGKKMGKSLGNFINLNEFFTGKHEKLEKAYSPMTIRFFILQAHYRSTIDFSNAALKAAEKGFKKLMTAMNTLNKLSSSKESSFDINEIQEKCYQAINDDFNTPILIANLFEGVKIINQIHSKDSTISNADLIKMRKLFKIFVYDILGFIEEDNKANEDFSDQLMNLILMLRAKAKANKDWDMADLIREELNKLSVNIKDNREGSFWEKTDEK